MRITWRDGVTTVAVAAAAVMERAYFHNWDWPLVSSVRWTIGGVALMMAIGYVFGYLLDDKRSVLWSWVADVLAAMAVVLTGFGMVFADANYLVLLIVDAVVFWMASVVQHLSLHIPISHIRT